jgi:hypothetical protein
MVLSTFNCVSPTLITWLVALPLVLLSLQPAWFIGLVVAAAFFLSIKHKVISVRLSMHILRAFFLYVFLGSLPQLNQVQVGPSSLYSYLQNTKNTMNLYTYNVAATLYVYGSRFLGELRPDGLFRFYRRYSDHSAFTTVITSDYAVPIENGKVYTQSVYFRSDNPNLAFDLTFWTRRGRQLVPTVIEDVGGGLKRAYATYKTRSGDDLVQGPDLVNFRGDWKYIDIGYARLEVGYTPSYNLDSWPDPTGWERLLWWMGTAFLGWLVLCVSKQIFAEVDGIKASLMIGIGFIVHVGIGLGQYFSGEPRVAGLTVNPNTLGASSVMSAGLVWLLGGWLPGLLALVAMAGMVWISGSRAAFLGGLFLSLVWLSGLPRAWKLVVGTTIALGIAFVLFFGWQDRLGRFMTITDPNTPSTQSRLEIWQVAWQAFKEHPLTGIGANRFGLYYLEHRPPNALEPAAPHAHNLFLNLLAETGLLGTAAFLILWGAIVRTLIRLRAWNGLVFVGIAFLLNLFDYTFFNAAVYYPLWAGIAWAMLQAEQNERAVIPAPRNHNHPDTLTG